MTERNSPPANMIEALRRIYQCNWKQLADRLGVDPRTVREWRETEPSDNGKLRINELWRAAMIIARADEIRSPVNAGRSKK